MIQTTVDTIQSAVDRIDPIVSQPVTLATGLRFQGIRESHARLECVATNVTTTPIAVTCRIFDSVGHNPGNLEGVVLQAQASDEIFTWEAGNYWCEFSYVGPANAIRADLVTYERDESLDERVVALTEAR